VDAAATDATDAAGAAAATDAEAVTAAMDAEDAVVDVAGATDAADADGAVAASHGAVAESGVRRERPARDFIYGVRTQVEACACAKRGSSCVLML